MIVGDYLKEVVEGTVINTFSSLLNYNSLDVRLSKVTKREALWEDETEEINMVIKPKEFVLGITEEYFVMPPNISAMFSLRSVWARKGLEQSTSVWLNPGWEGNLILELVNQLKVSDITLYQGAEIGQLHFFECKSERR